MTFFVSPEDFSKDRFYIYRKGFLILWFLTRSESWSVLWEQVKVERRRGVILSSRRVVNLWTRKFLFHQRIGEGLLNVPFFQSVNTFLISSPKLALEFVKSLQWYYRCTSIMFFFLVKMLSLFYAVCFVNRIHRSNSQIGWGLRDIWYGHVWFRIVPNPIRSGDNW